MITTDVSRNTCIPVSADDVQDRLHVYLNKAFVIFQQNTKWRKPAGAWPCCNDVKISSKTSASDHGKVLCLSRWVWLITGNALCKICASVLQRRHMSYRINREASKFKMYFKSCTLEINATKPPVQTVISSANV